MNDVYNLKRFLEAQQDDYQQALSEIKSGKKQSHWMWYIFPQFEGLGQSEISDFYAIKSTREAQMFLNHNILGERLKEITQELLKLENKNVISIFGSPDDLKLKSCMTLFSIISRNKDNVFKKVIDVFFDGKKDSVTISLVQQHLYSKKTTKHKSINYKITKHKIMKIKYYYIHGLNSSNKSSKFLLFTKNDEFENMECFEWFSEENLSEKIEFWSDNIKKELREFDRIVLIGDSFGGNLACQIKEYLQQKNSKISLVLINPLLDVSYLINNEIISNHLTNYIVPATQISESLIFLSQYDEIINNIQLIGDNPYLKYNNQIILDLQNEHKFSEIDKYFEDICAFVYNVYL